MTAAAGFIGSGNDSSGMASGSKALEKVVVKVKGNPSAKIKPPETTGRFQV